MTQPRASTGQQIAVLIGFLAISAAVAAGGSLATISNVEGWFADAAKPAWMPPNWLFAPAWSLLYALIAVAAWLIWRAAPNSGRSRALRIYWVQIVLNAVWTPLFFAGYPVMGPLALWLGLVVIVALVVTLGMMLAAYRPVSPAAMWMMVPYLAWVTFATTLNAAVAVLNS